MPDYIFLMHGDTTQAANSQDWEPYISRLRALGAFEGGSAIGMGEAIRKTGAPRSLSLVTGFIRVSAQTLDAAKALLDGNPVYEAGGTVEIRELPKDG